MDPIGWLLIVGALLAVGLVAFALTRSARGPGPPAREPRNAFERFWDTPEHSDAWDEERERGPGPHERPQA